MAGSRRRWGWHQLDPAAAERFVDAAGLPPRSLVLDIGAGTGALTRPLAAARHRVVAIEAHPGRARALRATLGDEVRVVCVDAADLWLPRRPFHVVANLPFGVAGAVLRRLLDPGSRLVTAHVMVQEQMARRWSTPDAPAWARWSKVFAVSVGAPVPRAAFSPPPRVGVRVLEVRRR